MKKKNQIFEYHASSPKRCDKENIRLINEKSLNQVENWGKNLKNLWSVIGEKPPNLIRYQRGKLERID